MNLCLGVAEKIPSIFWQTVDVCGTPDFVTDAATMTGVRGPFEIIVASHILEHIKATGTGEMRVAEAVKALQVWRKFLVPGGSLYISVPDMDLLVNAYLANRRSYWRLGHTSIVDILGPIYGGQEREGNWHFMLYNFECLRECLEQAGYVRTQKVQQLPHAATYNPASLDNRSLNVIAFNP